MKINVDCMRDVLLYIEENLTVTLSFVEDTAQKVAIEAAQALISNQL